MSYIFGSKSVDFRMHPLRVREGINYDNLPFYFISVFIV